MVVCRNVSREEIMGGKHAIKRKDGCIAQKRDHALGDRGASWLAGLSFGGPCPQSRMGPFPGHVGRFHLQDNSLVGLSMPPVNLAIISIEHCPLEATPTAN